MLFGKLEKEQLREIVQLQLRDSAERLALQDIGLSVTAEAIELIADLGYEPEYGARPLRRVIQRQLDDKIADLLVAGGVQAGDRIRATAVGGRLQVAKAVPELAAAAVRPRGLGDAGDDGLIVI